jgi:glutamyl-tRNA reductase
MSLLVVGLSHRSAPVSLLERAALPTDAVTKLLHDTVATEQVAGAAVLATCNRIELYADVDKFHAGVAELSTLLARHSDVGLDELTPYLYVHYEDRAVRHLFSVACGLDSMVVGEGQILGQIKDALATAQDLQTASRLLNELFQQALRVGKRAHSETGIDRAGQSLVTFGLEQLAGGQSAASVQSWAQGRRALVIGAGSMSSLAATTLARAGVAEIAIANRTPARAERLARILGESAAAVAPAPARQDRDGAAQPDADGPATPGGAAAPHAPASAPRLPAPGPDAAPAGRAGTLLARGVAMERVPQELTRADIVVSCTGATGLVLTAETIEAAVAAVAGRLPASAVPAQGPNAAAPADAALHAGRGPSARSAGQSGQAGPCPLDPAAGSAVQEAASGFSVEGEAAVAGMDAAALEQHAAWVDKGITPAVRRPRSPAQDGPAAHDPAADASAIAALAAVAARGRVPELRGPRLPESAPHRPVVLSLLDLAMPRDVDAAVHRLAGVRLVDIESLAEASADAPMAADVEQVRLIVAEEVAAFGAAQRAAHITPTVVALRTMAADVVAGEIARLDGRLPGLDGKQRAEITQTVRRVVDKLLHAPTVRVKQLAAEPGGAGYADALRTLFDLDAESVAAVAAASGDARNDLTDLSKAVAGGVIDADDDGDDADVYEGKNRGRA